MPKGTDPSQTSGESGEEIRAPLRSLRGLGPGLRHLRHERGWSQRELAQNADISPTNLSAYERERLMPSTFTLGKVLDALDRDLDDLCRAMHRARADAGETSLLDQKHTVVEVKLKGRGRTRAQSLAEWELPGEEHVLVLSYRPRAGKAGGRQSRSKSGPPKD